MYIPDWHFVKKLKAYDDRLSVQWMPRHERWGIYRTVPRMGRLYDVPVLVHVVQGPGKTYRPLDDRALTADVTPRGGYEDEFGSRNVPKEDVQSVEEFIDEREMIDEIDRQELEAA